MAETLAQYIVKTGKEPNITALNFGTHSVEIQDTFAEMFHHNETVVSGRNQSLFF